MSSNNGYVKWYVFWGIMLVVFSCIGSLFTNQSGIKKEYRDYVLEIKTDMASVKKSVEWLEDFRPNIEREDISTTVNPYRQLEKPTVETVDKFIENLENAIGGKNGTVEKATQQTSDTVYSEMSSK